MGNSPAITLFQVGDILQFTPKRSPEPQSKFGQMKVSKGQSQPEVVAAAFLLLEAWFWVHHFGTHPMYTGLIYGFDCDSPMGTNSGIKSAQPSPAPSLRWQWWTASDRRRHRTRWPWRRDARSLRTVGIFKW